eukprot:m.1198188 g.1198188  ORF g.1198188 m.1198188 type:complete len:1222 (+) comp24570_c0_seq1:130-3795(+)
MKSDKSSSVSGMLGAALCAVLAIIYISAASRVMLGIWCCLLSSLGTVVYLRLRRKAIELKRHALIATENEASQIIPESKRRAGNKRSKCPVCLGSSCDRHKSSTAVITGDGVRISSRINSVLADIIELTVKKYILTWYSVYTDNNEFIVEVKLLMKEMLGRMTRRLRTIDMSAIVEHSLAPIVLTHIELYLEAKALHEKVDEKSDVISPHERALLMYCGHHHAALHSEQRYFRGLLDKVLQLTLPTEVAECPSIKQYFIESMSSALRPALDKLAAPHMLNVAVANALRPAKRQSKNSSKGDAPRLLVSTAHDEGDTTQLLDGLRWQPARDRHSALTHSLQTVLEQQSLLSAFQRYLTASDVITLFLLYRELESMVQSFPLGVTTAAHLADYKAMGKSVLETLSTCPPPARAALPNAQIKAVKTTLRGAVSCDLCSLDPFHHLFQAAGKLMEEVHLPAFLRSEFYFAAICGKRNGNRPRTVSNAPQQSAGHLSSSSRTLLPINQRKKRVKQEARIAAEITKLNLPPPPSALQEQHPELQTVQEVAKKKGLVGVFKNTATSAMAHIPFRRPKDKKKPAERPHSIAIAPMSAQHKHPEVLQRPDVPSPQRPDSKSTPASPQTMSGASSPRLARRVASGSADTSPVQRRRAGTVGEMSARPLSVNLGSTRGSTDRKFGSDTNVSAITDDGAAQAGGLPADWRRERASTESSATLVPKTSTVVAADVPGNADESSNADRAIADPVGAVVAEKHPMPMVQEASDTGPAAVHGDDEGERAGSGSNSETTAEKLDLTKVSTSICRWERRNPGSRQFVVYVIAVQRRGGSNSLDTGDAWEVERRYSDFAALEKELKKLYPEYLAELPDKRRFGNLDTSHIETRKRSLNIYLSSLLQNQLVHTDTRCTSLLYKFLDAQCDFKHAVKDFSVFLSRDKGKSAPLRKKERDFRSFTGLFNVTEDDIEDSYACLLALEVEKWHAIRTQMAASRAPPDVPTWAKIAAQHRETPEEAKQSRQMVHAIWNQNKLFALPPTSKKRKQKTADVSDGINASATPPQSEVPLADRVVHLVGHMVRRFDYGWALHAALGFGRMVFGSSIETNLEQVCGRAFEVNEEILLDILNNAKDVLTADPNSDDASADTGDGDGPGVSPAEAERALKQIRDTIQSHVPELVFKIFGKHEVDWLLESIVDVFQDETYNKQLLYLCLDAVVEATYPEIPTLVSKIDDGAEKN